MTTTDAATACIISGRRNPPERAAASRRARPRGPAGGRFSATSRSARRYLASDGRETGTLTPAFFIASHEITFRATRWEVTASSAARSSKTASTDGS